VVMVIVPSAIVNGSLFTEASRRRVKFGSGLIVRSAQTWETHFTDLGAHRFHSLGMASDRGVGLKAGYQAACQDGFWVCDQFGHPHKAGHFMASMTYHRGLFALPRSGQLLNVR
ncbi:MAG: hypothetical protein V3U27_21185, partial [Candidatus Tectomicrobia bacterium]